MIEAVVGCYFLCGTAFFAAQPVINPKPPIEGL